MKTLRSCFVVAGIVFASNMACAQDYGLQVQSVLSKHSPAIVTVKLMLKTSMKGQPNDQSSPLSIQGAAVNATGLVMVSNFALSPNRAMEMFGRGGGGDMGVKITPTSMKVRFDSEDKEYDAFLAATDTILDLAFIQIESLGDRKVEFVDFSTNSPVTIGQTLLGVNRLHKGYDFAPYCQSSRVVGEIAKPRRAVLLEGNINGLGLPVFALTGESVGVLTTITGGNEDSSAEDVGMGMVMRMLTGGGGSGLGVFVLPNSAVRGVVDQAAKRATTLAIDRTKKKDGKPTVPAVPQKPSSAAGTKKPGKP